MCRTKHVAGPLRPWRQAPPLRSQGFGGPNLDSLLYGTPQSERASSMSPMKRSSPAELAAWSTSAMPYRYVTVRGLAPGDGAALLAAIALPRPPRCHGPSASGRDVGIASNHIGLIPRLYALPFPTATLAAYGSWPAGRTRRPRAGRGLAGAMSRARFRSCARPMVTPPGVTA